MTFGFIRASALASLVFVAGTLAQHSVAPDAGNPLAAPANGMRRVDLGWQALTNATIHLQPGKVIEHATLVVRDGKIVAILTPQADAKHTPLPIGPIVRDCTGLHIYPGFIDAFVTVSTPVPDPNAPGAHWNTKVIPQRRVSDGPGITEKDAEALRSQGFVAAALVPVNAGARSVVAPPGDDYEDTGPVRAQPGGIFRGHGSVVSLQKKPESASADKPPTYREDAFHALAFELGGRGGGGGGGRGEAEDPERWPSYPGSEMGLIALLRQTLSDADWIAQARKDNYNVAPGALDSLADRDLPLYFDVADELEVLRAARIAREFKRPAIIKGSGLEFRRIDAIAEALAGPGSGAIPMVIPLAYPKAPDAGTVGAAESLGLREMMTWEQAPSNARRLHDKGVRVALTTADLRSRSQFRSSLEKAMRYGLDPDAAFAMLTTEPAAILGVEKSLGTIEAGKAASFVVASGDLFSLPADEPEEKGADRKPEEKKADAGDASPKADKSEEKPEGDKQGDKQAGKGGRGSRGGKPDAPKSSKPEIRDVYVDGVRYEMGNPGAAQLAGVWDLTLDKPMDGTITLTFTDSGELTITKTFTEQKDDQGNAKVATVKPKGVAVDARRLAFSFEHKPFGSEGVFTSSASLSPAGDSMSGVSLTSNGGTLKWTATRRESQAVPPMPKAPSMVGCYLVAEIDGKVRDGADPSYVFVKKDGSVTLRNASSVLRADEPSIKDGVLKYTCDMLKMNDPQRSGLSDRLVKVEVKPQGTGLAGTMIVPDGSSHTTRLERVAGDPEVLADLPVGIGYPFGPYEREDRGALAAAPEVVVITNATVWTSGPAGNIAGGYVVLRGGKIDAVGSGSAPAIEGAKVIDAQGKHVTPGIIDCHSHTGISKGVNEGGQAITSEVRIQDVLDPDSINWYRQLAGGVTTVNNLHGSANAIGGQNAINKLRWGVAVPDEMHFAGVATYDDSNPYAPGAAKKDKVMAGVKWALGENPRGVNGGARSRYPQTRMGVSTLMHDRMEAAKEYRQSWKDWADGKREPGLLPPRRDLELEALAEVLDGTRLVHCHSYRQDELLALAQLCKEFNFKLGTWQHILEGYKVATDVRDNARGASAFADWWNYKVEVQDAIAQGPTLMHDVGVVVSYNSDSDEMARRLNLEAAKAVKYGNLPPEEALKFVTINPAIQLAIEDRVGSLEPGKQADVVIWSGDPLSVRSHAETVFIDGREMFSLERDAKLRNQNAMHRQRIIQKLKKEGPSRGGGGDGPASEGIDELEAARERAMLDMLNRRGSLNSNMPGECGCGIIHSGQ